MGLERMVRFVREAFREDLGLKALALAVAVGLWWFVAGERNVRAAYSVPLEFRNIPDGMAMANDVLDRVDVRLEGPSTVIAALGARDVVAEVDLSGRREGRQTVYVHERSVRVPAGLRILRIDPRAIEVVLARLERRTLPVAPRIGGDAAMRRRIARIEVEPPSLEVEGIPAELARLSELPTEEIVPDARERVVTARTRVETKEGHVKIVGDPAVRVTVVFRR